MVNMEHFTKHVLEYNNKEYLEYCNKKVNNGEGYLKMVGNNVVVEKYLTGYFKVKRDRNIKNTMKNIASFDI